MAKTNALELKMVNLSCLELHATYADGVLLCDLQIERNFTTQSFGVTSSNINERGFERYNGVTMPMLLLPVFLRSLCAVVVESNFDPHCDEYGRSNGKLSAS